MFRPRINEYPACKAVVSGWKKDFGEVFEFMGAWIPGDEVGSPFASPDFLCFNNEPMSWEWIKLLADASVDTLKKALGYGQLEVFIPIKIK